MGKDEPWFKPRANEDDDDAMLDAKFGRGNNPPPAKKGGGGLCGLMLLAGLLEVAAAVGYAASRVLS